MDLTANCSTHSEPNHGLNPPICSYPCAVHALVSLKRAHAQHVSAEAFGSAVRSSAARCPKFFARRLSQVQNRALSAYEGRKIRT